MVDRSQFVWLACAAMILQTSVLNAHFGGEVPSKWTAEARIANVIFDIQKKYRANLAIKQVIVSVPLKLQASDYHPFGDGQSNAQVGFGPDWHAETPPLVAVKIVYIEGHEEELFYFHQQLNVSEWKRHQSGAITYVQPKGWEDWFAVSFATQVLPIKDFSSGLPPNFQFSDGRKLPDPEGIKHRAQLQHQSIFQTLSQHTWGSGYNTQPYLSDNLHGKYPNKNGAVTAVGQGWTWLIDKGEIAPLKQIYICFSGRDKQAEAAHGVPSGSGWHHIGDPAESIVNSLEQGALIVAVGRTDVAPPNAALAYQLNAVMTATLLQPNEVFVTYKNQFHWYATEHDQPVCTEIWVHACVPSITNYWGFDCD